MPENPENKEEQAETIHQFKNVKAPDYRTVYSNNALFQTGPFDFNIIFGEISGLDSSGQVGLVEQHVRVTMSPLHAKLFAALVLQQVRGYEAQFGKINIPPGMIQTPAPTEVTEPSDKVDEKDKTS